MLLLKDLGRKLLVIMVEIVLQYAHVLSHDSHWPCVAGIAGSHFHKEKLLKNILLDRNKLSFNRAFV